MSGGNFVDFPHSPLLKYPPWKKPVLSHLHIYFNTYLFHINLQFFGFSFGLVVISFQLPQLNKLFDMCSFDICMIHKQVFYDLSFNITKASRDSSCVRNSCSLTLTGLHYESRQKWKEMMANSITCNRSLSLQSSLVYFLRWICLSFQDKN